MEGNQSECSCQPFVNSNDSVTGVVYIETNSIESLILFICFKKSASLWVSIVEIGEDQRHFGKDL